MRDAVVLPAAADRAGARSHLLRAGGRARQREEASSSATRCGSRSSAAIRRRSARTSASTASPTRSSASMPKGVLLPESGRDAVDAAGVHRRSRRRTTQRHSNSFQNIARLKPGATVQQAQQQVDALNTANLDALPAIQRAADQRRLPHDRRAACRTTLVRDIKTTLYLMWGGALFVLLIGCVNVANLVLVRSRARIEGAGDAPRARRGPLARRTPARHRERAADDDLGGRRPASSATRRCGCSARINIQELPRGEEIRLDGVVDRLHARRSPRVIGFVLGLIPVANVLPANLTIGAARGRAQRHRRPRRAHAAPHARRRAGRRLRSSC